MNTTDLQTLYNKYIDGDLSRSLMVFAIIGFNTTLTLTDAYLITKKLDLKK